MNNFFATHPFLGFILTVCASIISYIIPEFQHIHAVLKSVGQDVMIIVAILTGIGTMFKLDYKSMVMRAYVYIRNKVSR